MYILVSGSTKTVNAMMREHTNLGVLLTPADGNTPPPRKVIWAADNSVLTKRGFDDYLFRKFLKRIEGRDDCQFVAVPDYVERINGLIVGDAAKTLALWKDWHRVVIDHGLRPALVLQDGMTVSDVPWDQVGAVFVGGSDRYKLGETAGQIVAEANRRNLWTHMGRVSSARRLLYAAALLCCSIDGSCFSRWANVHLPWALRVARQKPLGLEEIA
jgi:hypothetical protein